MREMRHAGEGNRSLQLFGGQGSWTIEKLYDPASGTYFVPWLPEQKYPGQGAESMKRLWALMRSRERADRSGHKRLWAIIDTGILAHHPLFRSRIMDVHDLTGEGPDDRDGHGTFVAAFTIMNDCGAQILSIKVKGRQPVSVRENVERLAHAIRYAVYRRARLISVSVGFPTPSTEVHEGLCAAVREAISRDVVLSVTTESQCPADCNPNVWVYGLVSKEVGLSCAAWPNAQHGTSAFSMIPYDKWREWLHKPLPSNYDANQPSMAAVKWCRQGAAIADRGEYRYATVFFDVALEIDPLCRGGWFHKGMALAGLGKHQDAISCYDRALDTDPRNASVWNNKGVALRRLGRFEEAVGCYDRALEIDPTLVEAWNGKGVALAVQGRYEEALSYYDRALELDPTFVKAWNSKGAALEAIGKYQEAFAVIEKALKIDPRHVNAWYNKGVHFDRLGKHHEAIGCYDRVLELDPRQVHAWNNKGVALAALERYNEALPYYSKALDIDPTLVNVWNNKGVAYAALGKFEEAIRCYERALELDRAFAEAWYGKGVVLEGLNMYEAALTCYDKALALNPGFVVAWRRREETATKLNP
ncbi:MAG: tetratricopeptide repeat protein [Halobacteriota archaeon]